MGIALWFSNTVLLPFLSSTFKRECKLNVLKQIVFLCFPLKFFSFHKEIYHVHICSSLFCVPLGIYSAYISEVNIDSVKNQMKSLINISWILCINTFLGDINLPLSNSYRTLVEGSGTPTLKWGRIWLRDTQRLEQQEWRCVRMRSLLVKRVN